MTANELILELQKVDPDDTVQIERVEYGESFPDNIIDIKWNMTIRIVTLFGEQYGQ